MKIPQCTSAKKITAMLWEAAISNMACYVSQPRDVEREADADGNTSKFRSFPLSSLNVPMPVSFLEQPSYLLDSNWGRNVFPS